MSAAPVSSLTAVADTASWLRWPFVPDVVLLLLALTAGYALAAGPLRARLLRLGGPPPRWLPPGTLSPERYGALGPGQVLAFHGGILVVALALLSPLHTLGEEFLLSAHMVQHLLLTLVAPPLILLGTPGWMLRPLLRAGPLRRLAGWLLTPLPAFLLFNAAFTIWHVPPFYQLALVDPLAHAAEHTGLLLLALVTWWPVCGSLPECPRLPHGAQVLYLFFASLPPTVLGAVIALASVPIYPLYWAAPRALGLSPLEDQQIGGLIMWIPGALIYFLALSIVFFLWVERRSPGSAAPYGTVNPDRARAA